MFRLIKPTTTYKRSFIAAIKEFQREERKKDQDIKKLQENFSEFLTKMRNYEKGKNLPKGYVSASYYWLVDNNDFVGETTIRHKLTKALLKEGGHIGYGIRPTKRKLGYGTKILTLALKKAKKLGIKKVLVTCDDNNIGSRKVIEANEGILEKKIRHKGKLLRHYWIKL